MKQLLNFVIICSFAPLLGAAEKNKSVYPDAVAPNITFELINKSKSPIGIILNTAGKSDYYILDDKLSTMDTNPKKVAGTTVNIPVGATFAAQVDLMSDTSFSIGQMRDGKPSGLVSYRINAPGKTRYMSYDDKGRLYPQTGPLMGLGKYTPNFIMEDRTNTGLLKRNNVEDKDIMKMQP